MIRNKTHAIASTISKNLLEVPDGNMFFERPRGRRGPPLGSSRPTDGATFHVPDCANRRRKFQSKRTK